MLKNIFPDLGSQAHLDLIILTPVNTILFLMKTNI